MQIIYVYLSTDIIPKAKLCSLKKKKKIGRQMTTSFGSNIDKYHIWYVSETFEKTKPIFLYEMFRN